MKVRHEINIVDVLLTAATGVSATSAAIVQLDTTKYGSPTYYFEIVVMTSVTLATSVSLRRKGTSTDDCTITVPLGTTAYTRIRSTSFTPPSNQTEYVVFIAATAGATKNVKAARIIIIDATTTVSQTQIEIGNQEGITTTAPAAQTKPKYWKYDAAKWDGTKTFYAEAVHLVGSGSGAELFQYTNGTYTGKYGVTTVTGAAWGPGANGGPNGGGQGGDGGAGGGYSTGAVSTTPGGSYSVVIQTYESSFASAAVYSSVGSGTAGQPHDSIRGGNGGASTGPGGGAGGGGGVDEYDPGGAGQMPGGGGGGGSHASTGPGNGALGQVNVTWVSGIVIVLQEDNGAFASWANKVTIINAAQNTTYVRTRVAFTPVDGRHYRIVAAKSDGSISPGIYCAKIIVDQTGTITKLEEQYLLAPVPLLAGTALQTFLSRWDSTEWTGVSLTINAAVHAADNSTSVVEIDTAAGTQLAGSPVTSPDNEAFSSAVTMPATGDIDCKATTNNSDVYGVRLLASVVAIMPPLGKNYGPRNAARIRASVY